MFKDAPSLNKEKETNERQPSNNGLKESEVKDEQNTNKSQPISCWNVIFLMLTILWIGDVLFIYSLWVFPKSGVGISNKKFGFIGLFLWLWLPFMIGRWIKTKTSHSRSEQTSESGTNNQQKANDQSSSGCLILLFWIIAIPVLVIGFFFAACGL